ncbi:MAG: SOS response-associated peptidase, partial [Nannocystaceae bacterium]
PVILDREDLGVWLEPPEGRRSHAVLERVGHLLRPAPNNLLAARKVSTRVNAAHHDDPACLLPPEPPAQSSLF